MSTSQVSTPSVPIHSGHVELEHGRVYFETCGPDVGPPVVLVHGIASGGFVWDRNFTALSEIGRTVLRFDLYGRSRSAKPQIRYDLDLYCEQIRQLLEALGIQGAVDVVGLSMGGAVSVGFADRYPDMVRKLALIAPAGAPGTDPWIVRLLKREGWGEVLYKLIGARALILGARRSFRDPAEFESFFERLRAQFSEPGYLDAILSSLRFMPIHSLADAYQRVGRHERDSLLIWGDRDQIIPYPAHVFVRRWMPNLHFEPLEGAGHACNLEDSDFVNALLVRFLGEGADPA